ncbi:fucolectin-1-like [Leptodactylus fuscus]|uniref:fucolectin-1-like n=1 Tax=Leptodactylus fuscus TaxID=238119 RepID=UPI003F4E7683
MGLLHSAALLWILCTAAAEDSMPTRNIALHGRATQSTVYSGTTSAINAIDGNLDTDYSRGSCSWTTAEVSPWWRVDLLRPYKISQIAITNSGAWLDGAKLLVGNSLENNGNSNPICAEINSIPDGGTKTFQCNYMVGRYVNIFLEEKHNYLQVCEVEIFGVPESNECLCF